MSDPTRPFDSFHIDFLCPHCGHEGLKPIKELIDNLAVSCGCGSKIVDISSHEWRTLIDSMAEVIRHITALPIS